MSDKFSQELFDAFSANFSGAQPLAQVRAPGRLNIIGEHTDYNGLPVLPFAVNTAIQMIFTPDDTGPDSGRIEVVSLDMPDDSPVAFDVADRIEPFAAGHWGNYLKAAVQDGVEYARERGLKPERLRGLRGVLKSDLPMSAGLSSSSALVVAMMLAFYHVNGWTLPPEEMALRAAGAEHYVGTRGGGMDQTVSLCGREGMALKVDFHPLQVTPVPVDMPCSFMVAHSTAFAAKSAGARWRYNQRVFECRVLTELVSRRAVAEGLIDAPLRYLGDVRKGKAARLSLAEWTGFVGETLSEIPYDFERLEREVGPWAARLLKQEFPRLRGHLEGEFPLHQRAMYLMEEWARVETAARLLAEGDMAGLGELLFAAHEGLALKYNVSHPRVDQLIELARSYGLPGARMVGAGFGGVTLHLVPDGAQEDYRRYLEREFYREYLPRDEPTLPIWTFTPSAGAAVGEV